MALRDGAPGAEPGYVDQRDLTLAESAASGSRSAASGRSRRSSTAPSRTADGTMNFVRALRRAMATTGYTEFKEFQRVEVVVQ
jgi:hypothetical protein